MHRYLIIALLIAAVFLPACSMRRQGIREITLKSGGMGPDHTVNNYSVTFRRDGTAEMASGTVRNGNDGAGTSPASNADNETQQDAGTHKRSDVFDRPLRTPRCDHRQQRLFFKRRERRRVTDASQSLTVLTTTGERTIQTLGRNDPQIKSMLDAIGKLTDELQWEEVK